MLWTGGRGVQACGVSTRSEGDRMQGGGDVRETRLMLAQRYIYRTYTHTYASLLHLVYSGGPKEVYVLIVENCSPGRLG